MGGTGGTSGDAGDGGAGGADPCDACPAGCLDGICVDCTMASHCAAPTPFCEVATNTCVECLASDDQCPSGTYCAPSSLSCEPGCKTGASCASGSCLESRDCDRCIHDSECAEGRVCANGACSDPCTGEGTSCGTDLTCCSGHCVDTMRDINHCGACGGSASPNTCTVTEFCGTAGCENAIVSGLCHHSRVALVRDGQAPDDAAGDVLGVAFAQCAPAPTVRSVSQASLDVSNPTTGQPVAGPGELLVVAGGPFFQLIPRWLEAESVASVRHVNEAGQYRMVRTSDDFVVASTPVANVGPSHDLLVIEVVRDAQSGTLVLIVSGFDVSGTTAGAWYFANVMMPSLSSYDKAWYVFEWTDAGGNQLPDDAGEFVELGSAP